MDRKWRVTFYVGSTFFYLYFPTDDRVRIFYQHAMRMPEVTKLRVE